MYSQRRYGGSVNRGQPVPKGQQDSRQNRNNNSIRGKSTAAIAPNRNIGPAKSPHTTPHKKEDKIEKEVKTTDNKDSQLGEEGILFHLQISYNFLFLFMSGIDSIRPFLTRMFATIWSMQMHVVFVFIYRTVDFRGLH